MKKILLIFLFLFSLSSVASAANWYVRPSGGAGTGTSWTNAWNNFSGINWASVSCGDTIWVAGGTYSAWMQPTTKDCSSSTRLYVRRARGDDASCTGASGWSSSYDANVIGKAIAFNTGTFNYITISGRTTAGGGDYGWTVRDTTTLSTESAYGIVAWTGASVNYLTVEYMDISGPNRAFYAVAQWGSRGINTYTSLAASGHNTFSHLKVHGWCTGIYTMYSSDSTYEYIDMYDIGSNGGDDHPNLFYIKNNNRGTIRYSKFYNSAASGTGVAFSDGGPFADWKVYGNRFYDMTAGGVATAINVQSGTITGLKIFNNTFSNNGINLNLSGGAVCGANCESRNNIFFGSGGGVTCGATSNNLTSSNSGIFVSSATKDFHIVSSTGSGYPRNAGTNLSTYFSQDAGGITFGADGAWDIGAFEYDAGSVVTYLVTPSASAGGSILPTSPQSILQGNAAQFSVVANSGYTISVGGTCGGILSGNIYTTNPVYTNCTVVASFAPLTTYTVLLSAGTGGAITPAVPQTVLLGAYQAVTTNADVGYSFASLSLGSGCTGYSSVGNIHSVGPITGNCTVTANFAATSVMDDGTAVHTLKPTGGGGKLGTGSGFVLK